MYHLKLCKGRSYSNGKVAATKRNPNVFVEDKATADALTASGYFKLIGGEATMTPPPGEGEGEVPGFPPPGEVVGHLDREQLESMTIPDLKKLAEDMGVNIKGLKAKADIINAIVAVEVSAPAFDAETLAAMSDEELKAFVEEKGIDLTGCETREDALEAISVALGGSYTMLDLMRE